MRIVGILILAGLAAGAADYRTPAGPRQTRRTEEGPGTILPGGRMLTPFGTQYTTGPGPFGLAVSANGQRIVTANGGPDRFSLTILETTGDQWRTRQLAVPPQKSTADADDDWKSTFMGLAFDGEETLYASEGESGQVRAIDPATGRRLRRYNPNANGFDDSYSGDLALDSERGILYVVDQANFRVVVFDVRHHRQLASVGVGRLPYAIALSPDRKRVYVTNVGMFAYKALPGADAKRARETGIAFPAFGFPSKESLDGTVVKNASGQSIVVPGLGDPNVPQSNSLCAIDVEHPEQPKVIQFVRTGLPFGPRSLGGSSPSGVIAVGPRVFVSNGTNDSVAVINADTLAVEKEIELRIPGLEHLRGVLPIGLGFISARNQLLVAEAGINAVGVIDLATDRFLGHIPAGWFPTRVVPHGETIYVSNAKGHGIGPNATLHAPMPQSFQLERRRGSLSRYPMPDSSRLAELSRTVLENNGFTPVADAASIPTEVTHVVIIVKENRTFDEVFGDMAGAPDLARYGRKVTPNHHAMADRWAMSDNFYADSEVSVDGHHWLVGSYPNEWMESSMMASYANGRSFRLTPNAPGRLQVAESNSSVTPEDQLEAGTLWHHLARHGIPFRNFGEGFELPGIDEGVGLKPTGGRFLTNVPMPEPLFENTSREYPGYNMNIPDQFRATQFIHEMDALYAKPRRPLPRLIFIHLPEDHTTDPRPADGYPTAASYVADNDYALGRIVEYLSHTPEWRNMAIFVTEDDANGGVDHIDAHRTVMLIASPWAKRGYVAHTNSSFTGMLKTVYRILGLGPLNLFDAASADLSECFTTEPDFRPYLLLPVDKAIFDPANAREPLDPKPAPRMDDPRELKKEHERQRQP
jgi:DNA-binding beta-propeller fold protein YncE